MKKYIYLIVIILLLCNISIIHQYKKLEESANQIADKYSTLNITENRISKNLKLFSLYQQKYENSEMPIIDEYQKSENSFFDSINSGITMKTQLCFRFKETHCDACVQKTLNLINEIAESFPIEISVLCSFTNYNQFAAFKSKQSYNIRIINIKEISWDVDSIEHSYFFVIDQGRIHNLFIPLKEDWNYVKKYIHTIQHKYWEESSCSEECQLNGMHT